MSIKVNYTDKFYAGVHHSFTITSDEGMPAGQVLVGDTIIPHRIIHMQDPKYKISFHIPKESLGKELVLKLKAGTSDLEEKKEISASE